MAVRFYEESKSISINRLPQRSYYIPKNDGAHICSKTENGILRYA